MTTLPPIKFHSSLTKTDKEGQIYYWLDLYQANSQTNHKAVITFFLADSDTDSADLMQHKQQVESEFLIAIHTGEIKPDVLSITDNIVYCKTSEVVTVLKTFERMLAEYAFIWIDFQHLIDVLKTSKNWYFQQSSIAKSDNFDNSIGQIMGKLPILSSDIKVVLTCAVVPSDTSYEILEQINQAITTHLKTPAIEQYQAVNFDDNLQNSENDCWLGIFFITDL